MKHTDPPSPEASARQALPSPEASAQHDRGGGAGPHDRAPEAMHNEDVAHESSDINIRAIIASAVALGTVVVIVFGLVYGVFALLEDQAQERDPAISPLAAPAVQMPPDTIESPTFGNAPQPQLLTNEYAVLARQHNAEQQQLTTYGWIDQGAGVARIPIADAKKLLAERGIPARAGTATDPTLGTNRPSRGESNSGRAVDGPPRGAGLPPVAGSAAAPPGAEPAHKGGH